MGIAYWGQQKCYTRYNLIGITRSNYQRFSVVRKSVLRNSTKFTGKQLCQCLFFNKAPGLRPFSQNTFGDCFLPAEIYLDQLKYSTLYNLLSEQQKYSNVLFRITYSGQKKYSTPYNLLRIARFYSVHSLRYRVVLRIRTPLRSSQ